MPMFTSSTATVGKNGPHFPEYDTLFVTPSDSVDLPLNATGESVMALQVTGAGNINVQLIGGGTAVLTGLSAGQRVFVGVTRVLATSTTATGILALYGV